MRVLFQSLKEMFGFGRKSICCWGVFFYLSLRSTIINGIIFPSFIPTKCFLPSPLPMNAPGRVRHGEKLRGTAFPNFGEGGFFSLFCLKWIEVFSWRCIGGFCTFNEYCLDRELRLGGCLPLRWKTRARSLSCSLLASWLNFLMMKVHWWNYNFFTKGMSPEFWISSHLFMSLRFENLFFSRIEFRCRHIFLFAGRDIFRVVSCEEDEMMKS